MTYVVEVKRNTGTALYGPFVGDGMIDAHRQAFAFKQRVDAAGIGTAIILRVSAPTEIRGVA